MSKLKYLSIFFLTSIILSGCKKRETFENNVFFDKTFNWEIAIPDDYEKVNQKEHEKGKPLLIETKNSIVAFKRDNKNYFSANYEDVTGDNRSVDLNLRLKDFLFLKKIGQLYPKGKMGDYAVTSENISGLKFRKSKIAVTENGKTVATVVIFSSIFIDKVFTASIVYEDEEYGNAMINLFQKSTFKQ
ncbi:hypothetical protein [Flavobacterium sp. DG2-3]|uniref:hypothetical protein n=1 Tax=Flavobacterium sp. DG2-3 TaxID=3068317 RepID=UPI00273F13B5|nr:hypothetical protein [Flavobacterium sp. DG2-3]MDP5198323.1 hypothetical protein [Flavobacterium sp. DG2-3]